MTGLRFYLAIGGSLALIAGAAALYVTARSDGAAAGRAETINRVNKDNDDAGKTAEDWRASFRDCVRGGGGVFDFERGSCQR